jgi:hypothetical protein
MSRPDFAHYFLEGVDHFNAREFWHAHESWETIWLEAESDVEQFLQGLIQLAAAYHHVQRGTFRGAVRLYDAALRRLSGFPPNFCMLDRTPAEEMARRHREWTASLLEHDTLDERLADDDYPKLMLLAPRENFPPPRQEW